ncbi:centromere protein H (CENP-H)-domain-containing protein [Amylocarpus encephaloides]|uniref:Centromere protein H (CENP-H)-domain-containing protein n=1 Tax=Amylocarpus encephaloides TaxID=45428 RepID=A0A9P7YH00_9HELO|nr:centromere protein H (CENP-H)-domain-containing protein [Amylocarpus encephaloides]
MAQAVQKTEMEGVETSEGADENPPLFTDEEQRILDLYERMEELQLDIALLRSQGTLSQEEADDVSDQDVKTAQQELLQAKSTYQLRNDIVESVLVANPILKAVHLGEGASEIEQDLLPLLTQRDEWSVRLTDLSFKVLTTKQDLLRVETEHIATTRRNAEFAGQMQRLAKDADTQRRDHIPRKAQRQLDELDSDVKYSQRRWRMMKGVAGGTIVGSGIDWARDTGLLGIVLDDEA